MVCILISYEYSETFISECKFFLCGQNLDKASAMLLSWYSEELNGTVMEHGPFLGLLPYAGFYPSYLPTLMSNIAQHVMRFTSNGYIQEIQLSCA